MGTEARGPGWTRWIVACAVLFGLFLMHGAPTGLADCSDAVPAKPAMAQSAASPEMPHTHSGPTVTPMASGLHRSQAAAAVCMDGAMCVSTPSPRSITLPAVLLLAVLVVTGHLSAGAAALRLRGVARRRGPPDGGRQVLLHLCIART